MSQQDQVSYRGRNRPRTDRVAKLAALAEQARNGIPPKINGVVVRVKHG